MTQESRACAQGVLPAVSDRDRTVLGRQHLWLAETDWLAAAGTASVQTPVHLAAPGI